MYDIIPDIRIYVEDKVRKDFYELGTDSREFLIDTLSNFCSKAIEKFIKGQKEHEGIIYDRPMLPELEKELIDSIFYLAGAQKRLATDYLNEEL